MNCQYTVEVQDFMFDQIFEGLKESTHITLKLFQEERFGIVMKIPPTYQIIELERPLTIPTSFNKFMILYKTWDLWEPRRWRIYIGMEDKFHELVITSPAIEDSYNNNKAISCHCIEPTKLGTCVQCTNKCICGVCKNLKVDMVVFHYFPIVEQLLHAML